MPDISSAALIRITSVTDARVSDASDDPFTIFREPVSVQEVELPSDYALRNNYPNPFNAETTISFDLPADADVRISIYDIMGNLVYELLDRHMPAGVHFVKWSGQNDRPGFAASGIYYVSMRVVGRAFVRKVVLVK